MNACRRAGTTMQPKPLGRAVANGERDSKEWIWKVLCWRSGQIEGGLASKPSICDASFGRLG